MSRANTLIFTDFSTNNGVTTFEYSIDDTPYKIELSHSQPSALDDSKKQTVLFTLGMCYLIDLAEITLPSKISINFSLSEAQLYFWQQLYQEVSKEKLFVQKLDLEILNNEWESNKSGRSFERFTLNNESAPFALCLTGGKESLTLLKLLKQRPDLLLFFLNPESNAHRRKVFNRVKDEFVTIQTISNRFDVVKELKKKYNTTISSGVDMFHLVLNALFLNTKYVLIGNEYSSNFPNTVYQGFPINHQNVKTLSFAQKVNEYIHRFVTPNFHYYSPFFGFYEYKIAKRLFQDDEFLEVWTSCNKITDEVNFCCNCHKCAFTYLITSIYVSEKFLAHYFSRDMLQDVPLFKPLMDFTGEKPLDCVGDKKEVWVALEHLLHQEEYKQKPVVLYFEKNIRPFIEHELVDFEKEVNSIQKIPQTLPAEIQRIIEEAFI